MKSYVTVSTILSKKSFPFLIMLDCNPERKPTVLLSIPMPLNPELYHLKKHITSPYDFSTLLEWGGKGVINKRWTSEQ